MAGQLYDANNVVVGEAYLFMHPWTLETDLSAILVPDDTPLFDVEAWEALGWESAGATHEGFKVNVNTSTTTINIEEQSTPVAERVENKGITIEAALAEDTLETIQRSWGGSNIVTQAASNTLVGTRKMTLSDEIEYWVAALEMRNYAGRPRRVVLGKASATGSGETSFRRSADKRTYPFRVASICKPSEIQIIDVVAPKTA